jgi:hypothetical protein
MQRATAAVMGEDQDEEGWGSQGSGEHSDVGQGGIQELESYRQSHQQPQQQQCQQGPKVVRIFRCGWLEGELTTHPTHTGSAGTCEAATGTPLEDGVVFRHPVDVCH